ncbi:hypothetical protein H257_17803 [Aphanomyces astaci]|uniref:Uncharacterized protein n=1 Tax=Aphanomyces astaci TaxID=112090 RepID=W4FF49_APHAT|nr:hypothetical protein H257_17803 [Aphanomyces astaci]ETV65466.1 hypothetical protein H257_17803 [Aphanomyces astaci]|eukprot:XP_009845048.1 hypothetical protein H257_17803 [Aphanomyces astaci]
MTFPVKMAVTTATGLFQGTAAATVAENGPFTDVVAAAIPVTGPFACTMAAVRDRTIVEDMSSTRRFVGETPVAAEIAVQMLLIPVRVVVVMFKIKSITPVALEKLTLSLFLGKSFRLKGPGR